MHRENMNVKTGFVIFVAMCFFMFAGCTTANETVYSTVLKGTSRNVLRANFGEPLRIEPAASGGEDWYYRFSLWQSQPVGSSGTNDDFGQPSTYASAGLTFFKQIMELPVHVSADGFLVPPLPKGKVVKN